MSNIDPLKIFRIEADELLEAMEQGLLDLLHDLGNMDLVNSVFRSLHTLKGSGAMFGFDKLAAFTHHCETAFDRVRKGEVPATDELISAVLATRDQMRALIETPNGDHDIVSELLLARLHDALGDEPQEAAAVGAQVGASAVTPAASGPVTYEIHFSLPRDCMANGSDPVRLIEELRDLGQCDVRVDLANVPSLATLKPTEIHLAWHVTLTTSEPRSAIDDVFIFVIDDMKLDVTEIRPEPAAIEAPAEIIAHPAAPAPASKAAAPANDAKSNKPGEHVRVPAERLDELMDRVGELVIAQSRLSQLAHSSVDIQLRAVSEDIERLSGELRDTMMGLRMVPVNQLFGRFRRLIHDLARETGKKIELVTEGETTEVDKTIIERLADPLVHLVRNSVDHGLETPEQRLAAGKPEAGTIRLVARQAGGEVIITIIDDGRGIDRERVRAKAETSGLIQPDQILGDQELLQLIFQPGFSTAASITNLSGRGVGMDVVKKTIDALRGNIDIVSRPGEGSQIELRIPLTLAIIDGLLVRVGNEHHVIPLSAVEECLELTLEEDLRSNGRNFISLRDRLVPYLRLREVFDTGTPPELHQKIVVVSTGSERVGLVVDQIIGDHQTVIKSMSKLHNDATAFSGATILGDGTVALILDVTQLVARGQKQEALMRVAV
jgi:two-component system chemotaxis sensor kinase CheA